MSADSSDFDDEVDKLDDELIWISTLQSLPSGSGNCIPASAFVLTQLLVLVVQISFSCGLLFRLVFVELIFLLPKRQ